MNYKQDSGFCLRISSTTWFYIVYITILYVLAIYIWPNLAVKEFQTYHYVLDINGIKLAVSVAMSLILLIVINRRYSFIESFSDQVILLLLLLYFLPGVVISGVLNFEWSYIFQYFLYSLAMIVFDHLVKHPKGEFLTFNRSSFRFIRGAIITLSFLYPFFLIRVFGKSLSLTEILLTLNDPYGVRNASKELNINWVILTIEYWQSYFSFVMITYFFKKKKYWLAALFIICGLFYFILQGKRIFFFFIIIAVCLGLFNTNRNVIKYAFLAIVGIQLIEIFFDTSTGLGMITNVFRRFSIVPNMISTSYFDYFQDIPKDWLRGTFTHLLGFLGFHSPYGYEINTIIGARYYGFNMYANTGMFGGSYFEFGALGILIDTLMFVFVLRIIEKILYRADFDYKFMFAIIWASLAINTPAIWSGCFKFSQYSLLLISLLFFFNGVEDGDKRGRN